MPSLISHRGSVPAYILYWYVISCSLVTCRAYRPPVPTTKPLMRDRYTRVSPDVNTYTCPPGPRIYNPRFGCQVVCDSPTSSARGPAPFPTRL
jgi:hypothetical protein